MTDNDKQLVDDLIVEGAEAIMEIVGDAVIGLERRLANVEADAQRDVIAAVSFVVEGFAIEVNR